MVDRRAGYLLFVQGAAAGKPLDDPTVVLATGKAHPWVNAGRILPQDALHRTLALHEFLPVQHRQIAQTKNGMFHREFVSRRLLDPRSCLWGTTGWKRARVRVVCNCRADQFPVALRRSNTDRHAAEVFDEAQPQHAANRPQFIKFQRRHGLVGAEELVEAFRVESGVEMHDQFPRQMVHSRQALAGSVAKVGQLAAVSLAEIPPGRSRQLLHPAEVLNEPQAGGSTGGRNRPALGRHPLQPIVHLLQNVSVVVEPGEQPIAAWPVCQLMRMSQLTGMLSKLLKVDLRARGRIARRHVG